MSRKYARTAIPGTPVRLFVATRIVLSLEEHRHVAGRADLQHLFGHADPTATTALANVARESRRGAAA
ncbi:hypothetical protein [Pseudoclavibacter endophyticus]|uniref:Uncharacterized protein n=1 Tax=Pseudoclavibacter endophyticus TaxID=1778590 RepID=A0A6H9WQT5_9MICO|nr:hypothetical protein [Pseudoclavibacter endophyticus]KAB1648405.1 hypothetical protein F8O04_12020 [Pseudoclavibacter endophyticus]